MDASSAVHGGSDVTKLSSFLHPGRIREVKGKTKALSKAIRLQILDNEECALLSWVAEKLAAYRAVMEMIEESDKCREKAFDEYDVNALGDLPEKIQNEHYTRYRKIQQLWRALHMFYTRNPKELDGNKLDLSHYDNLSFEKGTVDGFPSAEASDCDALRAVQVSLQHSLKKTQSDKSVSCDDRSRR